MKIAFLFALSLAAFFHSSRSLADTQELRPPAQPQRPLHIYSFITNIPEDLALWGKETVSEANLPYLGGTLAATAALYACDEQTYQPVRSWYVHNSFFRKSSDYGEEASKLYLQAGLLGSFTLAAVVTENDRLLRTTSEMFEAYLTDGIMVQLIKHVTGRQSPVSSTRPRGRWSVFPDQKDYARNTQSYDAMPSGHLSSVSVLYFVIEDNYPEQKWLPYLGYPVMAWSAFSLVGKGIHWWSDFPIALALSHQFAKIATRDTFKSPYEPQVSAMLSEDRIPLAALTWAWR